MSSHSNRALGVKYSDASDQKKEQRIFVISHESSKRAWKVEFIKKNGPERFDRRRDAASSCYTPSAKLTLASSQLPHHS